MAGGATNYNWMCPACEGDNDSYHHRGATQVEICHECESEIDVNPITDIHHVCISNEFNAFAPIRDNSAPLISASILAGDCNNYNIWVSLMNHTADIADSNNTTLDEIHQFTNADFMARCLAGIYIIPNTIRSGLLSPCECGACRYITLRMLLSVPQTTDMALPSYDVAHNTMYPITLSPNCPNKSIYEAEHNEIQIDSRHEQNWTEVAIEYWTNPHDSLWTDCNCPMCRFELRHRDWISGNVEAILIIAEHEDRDDDRDDDTEHDSNPDITYSLCTRCGMNIQDDPNGNFKRQHDILECTNAAQ
jgi:hypothetical protein